MQIGLLCFDMKKILFTLLLFIATTSVYADSLLYEGFEYANHDGQIPIGWTCADNSWLCGYLDKDHNRTAHTGNWYAYTNAEDSWMFMEMYSNSQLKYRYYCWAISDGEYDLEFWLGNGPSATNMTHMLFTKTINSSDYQHIEEFIQSIPSNYQYLGIHAIAHEGAYHLTIDDLDIHMVEKYSIAVDPAEIHNIVAPGSQVEYSFQFINLGYEPSDVIILPTSEHFTDIHLYKNGTECTTFYVEAFEVIEFTGVATLRPDIAMGATCWADVMFNLSCDCATAMLTIWAIAGNESVDEFGITTMNIYPNPSSGNITIEGSGMVTITNTLGQEVFRKEIVDKETVTLEKGVYFVRKEQGQATKIIVE